MASPRERLLPITVAAPVTGHGAGKRSPPRPRILVRLSWSLGALTLSPNVPTAAARPLRSGLVLQGRAWLRRLPSLGLRRGPPPSMASGHASTL